jgi:hypothetical protein
MRKYDTVAYKRGIDEFALRDRAFVVCRVVCIHNSGTHNALVRYLFCNPISNNL